MNDFYKVREVTKSTAERYNLRYSPSGWAVITIADDGMLNIQSDWGNYNYWWGSPGMPFKNFLIDMAKDMSYLAMKLAHGSNVQKQFFMKETRDAIKKDILRDRRDGHFITPTARQMMDELDRACFEGGDNQYDFFRCLEGSVLMDKMYPDYEVPIVMGYDPGIRDMLNMVWPPFVEQLKKEVL